MSQPDHLLSNEQLLEVFALTNTATAIHIGEDAIIQTANDAMLRIWGRDRSVIGKSLEDALPELNGQPFIYLFKKVWTEGLTISGSDTAADIEVDGQVQTFYFDFEYRAIKDTQGHMLCILHTATDVTERFLNREALERAQEKAEALEREQALNEELAAANEELNAINEELEQSQDSLYRINNELESRVERRTKALADSESKFRSLVQQSPVPMLVTMGEKMIFEIINPPMLQLIGKDKSVIGKSWDEAMPELQGQVIIDQLLESYHSGREWIGYEVPITIKKDKALTQGYYNISYTPLTEGGQTIGLLQSAIDITEQVRARQLVEKSFADQQNVNEELAASNEELASVNEELESANEELIQTQDSLQNMILELAESEARFRNLVLLAPVGICMLKGDPLYVQVVNDTFLELIRRERRDFDNQSYWGAIPEAAPYYEPITRNVVTTGQTYYANGHEIKLLRKGIEETIYVDFVYEPIKNLDGTIDTILIVANEVTEQVLGRKKAEQAEESLRMATDAADLGTWYVNAKTNEFEFSPRLKQIFGFGPDEDIAYETAVSQIDAEYRQTVNDTIDKALKEGSPVNMEYPVISHTDGKTRWVRSVGKMVYNDDGTPGYITGIINDITEQKQDEIRKNDFIGMVSHELKTPLTSLSAIIQVANAKVKTSEDVFLAGAMGKADIQVKKMSKMINGFLNISRLESGKLLIVKQYFDVEELLVEMIEESLISGSGHSIKIERHSPLVVNADRDKIGSVISNLISNAVKYSPKGTTIEIKCGQDRNAIKVSIKDEGIGIKPNDAERVFDRYYRVENHDLQHISGFGIGLYLSAEIIKRHEGKIWVESEFGFGSTFYFTLPIAL